MTMCALCDDERPLRDSHILPEFLYAALYDEKHRFLSIPLQAEEREQLHQKGFREQLLCADCEQRIGRFERYASQALFHQRLTLRAGPSGVRIEGVDFRLFRLFLISVLWRAHVSRLPSFRQVDLGPHAPWFREHLRSEDPGGSHEYPCFVTLPTARIEIYRGCIVPPYRVRLHGVRAYRSVFAGLVWHFLVSSRVNRARSAGQFLEPDGVLPLIVASPATSAHYLEKLRGQLPGSRVSKRDDA